jgi:hypothetical protein
LQNEVVIEFDEDDQQLNRKLADEVGTRLYKDGIPYSKWHSGNKSYHIHFFIETGEAGHIAVLKKTVMRHYGTFYIDKANRLHKFYDKEFHKILPDLRLASDNHLIRAEYGVHEKTGQPKSLIYTSKDYPKKVELSQTIWQEYVRQVTLAMRRNVSRDVSQIQSLPGFKYIITSENFRLSDDGRERALFMLIHTLKDKYKEDKDGFVKYLQEWYRYSSGRKLTNLDIANKVRYHWNRNYTITTNYLNELLESIGREDLIDKKE